MRTPPILQAGGGGVGVSSVRKIVAWYDGKAMFGKREGIFYASVRLILTHAMDNRGQTEAGVGRLREAVAPGYMGVQEFVIPQEVTVSLLK